MRKAILKAALSLSVLGTLSAAPTIINAGVPGDNTDQIAARLPALLEEHRPTLVILLCGTNDMLNSYNALPLEKFESNLRSIIDNVDRVNASLILMELPDAYAPYVTARHKPGFFEERSVTDRIADANRILRTVADERRLPLLPLNSLLGRATTRRTSRFRNAVNSGAEDGIHPTPGGYALIARKLAELIAEKELPAERILCLGDSITFGVHVAAEENYPARLKKLLLQPITVTGCVAFRHE